MEETRVHKHIRYTCFTLWRPSDIILEICYFVFILFYIPCEARSFFFELVQDINSNENISNNRYFPSNYSYKHGVLVHNNKHKNIHFDHYNRIIWSIMSSKNSLTINIALILCREFEIFSHLIFNCNCIWYH